MPERRKVLAELRRGPSTYPTLQLARAQRQGIIPESRIETLLSGRGLARPPLQKVIRFAEQGRTSSRTHCTAAAVSASLNEFPRSGCPPQEDQICLRREFN